MSEIKLSDALIGDLQQALGRHDAEAQNDAGVTVQYLAAVIGYIVAEYPGPQSEKDEFLDQLHALARHVMSDRAGRQPQQAAAPGQPKGRLEPSAEDPAAGYWRADRS